MSKTALITGIRGQDGAYLAKHLLDKGYRVVGCDRRRVDLNNWRLKHLGIENDIEYIYMDLLDEGSILRTIKEQQPDELYNLAAQSFVGISFDQPLLTTQVDAIGVLRILEAIRMFKPDCKFYQASTSEMFGEVLETPQSEKTPLNPRSPYGVAKVYGHFISKNYRDSFGLYTSSGILFNHESPFRGIEFVTRKITNTVAKIKNNVADKLVLGNIDAKRDWGYAKDYTYGMYLMLQQDQPDDYVLATGETYSVRYFVEESFRRIGKDIVWKGEGVNEKAFVSSCANKEYQLPKGKEVLSVDSKYFRPTEVDLLIGDPTKAKEKLGWEATNTVQDLVKDMMSSDLILMKKDQHIQKGGYDTFKYHE